MSCMCSSLLSFLHVPKNMIGRAAYLQESDESMPIAATVAFLKVRKVDTVFTLRTTHLRCKMYFILLNGIA